jgi:YidC/Oxa1 family membrane protein insertase
MVYLFPLITWFFAISLPSGIVLYWIATNLFSIGQQVYVNREKDKEVTVRIKKEGQHEIIEIKEGDVIVTESETDIK